MRRPTRKIVLLLLAAIAGATLSFDVGCSRKLGAGKLARVDFNQQIRPILNQSCVPCHGGVKAAGGISFVFRDQATKAGESGRPTIVPGHPEQSELIRRLTSPDEEFRMPKAEHGSRLTPAQVALFRQWIAEGAEWSEHWAFVAPKPQVVPEVKNTAWTNSAIDRFVLARLERENLTPSAPAAKAELLRRVSFDLTGLPPTAEEIAAFVADNSPQAYEKQVERLLASPRYGERWATLWMDLARYADTNGYEKDVERSVWKYRDWLIDALNRNEPYDQFLVDQLAGDLIPNATMEQLIATSFHRQTQTNDEGGTDDEEFRMAAVMDRAAVTWVALNGVTFNCVQCHSHPYDPIRHQEYYSFLAFFNRSRDADYPDDAPTLHVPDEAAHYPEALGLERQIAQLRQEIVAPGKTLAADSAQWRALPIGSASATPSVEFKIKDGEAYAIGTVATRASYELTAEPKERQMTALRIEVPPLDPVKARHTPETGFVITGIEGWVVAPDGTERRIAFKRYAADSETVSLPPAGADLKMAYRLYLARSRQPGFAPKGKVRERVPTLAELAKVPFDPDAAKHVLPIAFAANPSLFKTRWVVAIPSETLELAPGSRLRVRLLHGRPITEKPAPARRLRLSTSDDPRWTALAADLALRQRDQRLVVLTARLAAIPGTNLPVMADLPEDERRDTLEFVRGNWLDKAGPPLEPNVPALFPPLPAGAPRNRLTLARWFVSPGQPLTARVAVNRYWEQLFGVGLVETLEDFGSVGEPPSHPELLDWLALHFEHDLKWDVKALLRELVTTATYRQTAHTAPALYEKDPRNRLLARGPRNRLTAEMVRDQALLAGGLLSAKMHGPPVMPPQPAGIWASVYNGRDWVESKGEDRFRRAVYTYWKRTSAYPSFLTFDAPTRDTCAVRRMPTDTPLQALVVLNDPVYHEAAAALAERMQTAGSNVAGQIALGMRLITSRAPTAGETNTLMALYHDVLESQPRETTAAGAMFAATSSAKPPAALTPATLTVSETASGTGKRRMRKTEPAVEMSTPAAPVTPELRALTAVAEAILNLDAALTK